jgi:polysaccharide biosynthesis protein PslF
MTSPSDSPAIAIVGTYPPTQCGIATFTRSLGNALRANGPVGIVRVMEPGQVGTHPNNGAEIVSRWIRGDRASRRDALASLRSFSAVVVQHEFGIFGGEDGEDIIEFLEDCEIPSIVVMHTAVANPLPNHIRIVEAIGKLADVVVVQSWACKQRLCATTSLDPGVVQVIPHGATLNLSGPAERITASPLIVTWGLLGHGKGIEHGIEALAGLQDLVPKPVYAVIGQTHPNVKARVGESYRQSLIDLAAERGLSDQVIFDDSYRDTESLLRIVRGADVILLPYDSREQVTSGVLVEAVASGKPIVATAFPHATEMLESGLGLVVRHGDSEQMTAALRRILVSPSLRANMQRQAWREAASLAWPAVANRYLELAAQITSTRVAA